MCNCKNIAIGSYKNQVKLSAPWWSGHDYVCVDKCLVDEIKFLWKTGVMTTGCCCGHNKVRPMINVMPAWEPKMLKLGYKYYMNDFNVKCFVPFSVDNKI